MPSVWSTPLKSLRTAAWHLREGGVPQLRLWWSRQPPLFPRRRRTASSATSASQPGASGSRRTWRGDDSDGISNGYLAEHGFPLPDRALEPAFEPQPRHALYLLHNALPRHSGGYATRTHGLLTELNSSGWDVHGVTRLGYPYDLSGMADVPDLPESELVGTVRYHHLLTGRQIEKKNPMFDYTERYVDALLPLARAQRPAILHGASNHWNGFAAVKAARRLGIASVYEVRGLWEVTRASRDPVWGAGDQYRYLARMEADAARGADRVIAITTALKAEMVDRGVDAEKITLVPNGVDTERFTPLPRDEELAAQLGVRGRTVIGYVGTMADYEGLGLLLDAVAQLRTQREDFLVLLVGDGAVAEDLRAQVERDGLADVVTFTGRVPHTDVERYYSLIDVTPFPRLPVPVTEIVSPLKPFEAMAMGKAVLASDVGALAEIVTPGLNGWLHAKGEVDSLVEQLTAILDDPAERARIGAQAREWVVAERDWTTLAGKVAGIYEELA